LTAEARAALVTADEVLCVVSDPVALQALQRLNRTTRSLHTLYKPGRLRMETYRAMVEEILTAVRRGGKICVALYGHPGVFAWPTHESIRRARKEGLSARMLPAVSAEDCLFADLGVDPGARGCQSYEATDFLLRRTTIDTSAVLILWQIAVVGNAAHAPEGDSSRLPILVERLSALYSAAHEVVLYEASPFPGCDPLIQHLPVAEIPNADVSPATTLYVPPTETRRADPEMKARLGMTEGSGARRNS
jgi:uncharacterized protein YabN with tetrapyrrole methylase and pyrophosphatase domain